MRSFALLFLAGTLVAGGKKAGHPHFDDKGALSWHTKFADAQKAAKKADKLIFIEYGRAL